MSDNKQNSNDLNELNSILFDTLRGVKDGNVDPKKANSVIGLSNALINNAKVQVQAIKLGGGRAAPEFFALPAAQTKEGKDRHELMTMFAIEEGYDSVAHAAQAVGMEQFKKDFENWVG